MRNITLQSDDFVALRQTLPPLHFQPRDDAPPCDPLLLKHLHDYQFPRLDNPQVTFRIGAFNSGDTKICGCYWLPADPQGTTFLVHGYFDHTGLYGHLIEYLLAQGQAVVAFDLPGHGLSGGEPLAIDSFSSYQQVLGELLHRCRHFPTSFNAVGQSTGGAVLLGLLQNRMREQGENPFQQNFLLAPLIRPFHWRRKLLQFWLLRPFVHSAKREFARNSHDRDFLAFLEQGEPLQQRRIPLSWVHAMVQWATDFCAAPTCPWPITVIQGGRDTTVAGPHNLQLIEQQFPTAKVCKLPEAMHHLVNERTDIRAEVFACLTFQDGTS